LIPQGSGEGVVELPVALSNVVKAIDQLAVSLQSSRDSIDSSDTLQDLAMALYQAENRSLYHRAMLMSGYPPNSVLKEYESPEYIMFALGCWHAEGQRLSELLKCQEPRRCLVQGSFSTKIVSAPEIPPTNVPTKSTDEAIISPGQSCHHQIAKDRSDNTEFVHNDELAFPHDTAERECSLVGGRHIHRLEGKCGHKAILHIPENGPVHIDFVVGNTVECYQDMQPISYENSANTTIWPSAYKCDDVSCAGMCGDELLVTHQHSEKCLSTVDPKVFHLDDIDIESKEWNIDFPFSETLLGLFKLGDSETSIDPPFNELT
jgi:hypothetical protein